MIVRVASVVLTLAGSLALVSGLLFWLDYAASLAAMHMLLGFLTVAALWTIGVAQALGRRGSWLIAAAALLIGALTVFLGLYQSSLLVGPLHWLIEVAHLTLGILTIGAGHMAAARYRKGGTA